MIAFQTCAGSPIFSESGGAVCRRTRGEVRVQRPNNPFAELIGVGAL
jgi:hypothetical protein